MKTFIYLSLSAFLLSACTWDLKEYHVDPVFQTKEDAFYFYAIGDWGREGKYGQTALAEMMARAAERVAPEFIISTGDNFYPSGVSNCSDPGWDHSFENVYHAESLQCDWYPVLGNHDYQGNVQAQIDYSATSDRWSMPARYFHKDVVTDDGTSVRFLFIDTNPFNMAYHSDENFRKQLAGQDTARQLAWMDSLLSEPFDWKIMIGHHPLYTGGSRSREESFVRSHIEPLLDRHQVDLYLAGHEHDLQHIKNPNHPTHHIISGAGSLTRPTGVLPTTYFSHADLGFFTAGITKTGIECQFMNARGKVIYHSTIRKE